MHLFDIALIVSDRQAGRRHEALAERLRPRRRRRAVATPSPQKHCACVGRPASRHT